MGGYGGLWDRNAEGTLDPPEARALVLDQGDLRVAWLTLDIVIVRPSLRDPLVEFARSLDVDALIVVATHTHSGPGGYVPGFIAERISTGGFNAEAQGGLIDAGKHALEAAVTDLATSRIAAQQVSLDLARNRRFDDGPAETQLAVIRFDRDAAQTILLFAYGAHPTVLSPRSRMYSADYIGSARRQIEKSGQHAFFLPGPLGDQEPSSSLGELWPRDVKKQQAQAVDVGETLANAVLDAAVSLKPKPSTKLEVLERWIETPPVHTRRFCAVWYFAPLIKGKLSRFLSARVPIHVLRLDGASFVTLPGEPTSWVASEIRPALGGTNVPIVVAHANDWLGYLVSPEDYRRGGYEACASFHGRDFGATLAREAVETFQILDSDPK